MDYQVKKIAMTGGTGPVGMALINKLLKENINILLFQREDSPRRSILPQHKLLQVRYYSLKDLGNYEPEEKDYDVFFHVGWAYTDASQRNNLELQSQNIKYACSAAELAHKLGCHTFIGIGSQAECGRHNEKLREDTLCNPENAYGIMKLCACHATQLICKEYGMRHVWPRILSGYGRYDNIKSVLSTTIIKAMNENELHYSSADQIWDFVHMDDVAQALYLIALRGRDGGRYPIGSGKERPLKEYILILLEKLRMADKAKFGVIPYREGQILYLGADITTLMQDTGWRPQIEFENGIDTLINFYMHWSESERDLYLKVMS